DNIYTASRSAADQAFSTPTLVTSLMTSMSGVVDFAPRISPDGLRMYFASTRGGTNAHIFLATRTSSATDFGAAGQLAMINSANDDRDEHLTGDGKTIVFASNRTGGAGGIHLFSPERPAHAASS